MEAKRAKNARLGELDICWAELVEGIQEIQARKPITTTKFVELYTTVYNYCVSGNEEIDIPKATGNINRLNTAGLNHVPVRFPGKQLYTRLGDLLRQELEELSKACLDKSGETLLAKYVEEWEQYIFTAKVVNGIFSYLNRHCIRPDSGDSEKSISFQVYQLAFDIWKETVFTDNCKNVTIGALGLLEKERLGDTINGALIQNVVSSFVDLGLNDIGDVVTVVDETTPNVQTDPRTGLRIALGAYQKCFEGEYLQNIREFYTRETYAFFQEEGNSVVDFMKKAEQRLNEERTRAEKYLHQSSRRKQILECEDTLIRQNLEVIYAEFSKLLAEEKVEDISRSYALVNKLGNALGEMAELFRTHIVSKGNQHLQELGNLISDPKQFVTAILDIHNKFRNLVALCFQDDALFKAALDKAAEEFINHNPASGTSSNSNFKTAELLARYCDILLKKSYQATHENEIEERQNDVMVVFKFLDDKDVFKKFYSKKFANRLILHQSSSEDAEAAMMAKLKHVCGYEYTSKLQRMYQDGLLSRELQEKFKELESTTLDTNVCQDFNPLILSYSSWPFTHVLTDFQLPNELEANIQAFNAFYQSKYTGRKLSWLYNRSRGDLTCNYLPTKCILQASVYQMAVLLMFNSVEELSLKEIREATKLSDDIVIQIIETLVKFKVCTCENDTELDMASRTKLNNNFKAKKLRVNINVPLKTEVKNESEYTEAAVDDDRKMLIQACVVRIMKMRKTIQHQPLLAEVMTQMSGQFKPSVPTIKKCIDILIQKEYLERTERDVYTYIT